MNNLTVVQCKCSMSLGSNKMQINLKNIATKGMLIRRMLPGIFLVKQESRSAGTSPHILKSLDIMKEGGHW